MGNGAKYHLISQDSFSIHTKTFSGVQISLIFYANIFSGSKYLHHIMLKYFYNTVYHVKMIVDVGAILLFGGNFSVSLKFILYHEYD